MHPLLEVKDLYVYHDAIAALQGASLTVGEGRIVSLVGANGAGKTTMMHTIIGINRSREGQVLLKGQAITQRKSHEIVALGLSLSAEGRQLFYDMTVRDNLVLGAYAKKLSKLEIGRRIDELGEIFPILRERESQIANTLSGGEQQMVAIAKALMSSPALLLLDEPSLGVSPILTQKIFAILSELKMKGMSILLAEQNAQMALEISDYGYVLELGKVTHHDSARALLSNDVIRKAYLGI